MEECTAIISRSQFDNLFDYVKKTSEEDIAVSNVEMFEFAIGIIGRPLFPIEQCVHVVLCRDLPSPRNPVPGSRAGFALFCDPAVPRDFNADPAVPSFLIIIN